MPATDTGAFFDFAPESIRARREELGLTREAIGIAVVRSAQTVQAWETGRQVVPIRARAALADALGLDVIARARVDAGLPADLTDGEAAQIAEILR